MIKNIASKRSTNSFSYNFKSFEPGVNSVNSDAVLSPNTARMCFNFEFKDGNLKTGLGIKFLEIVNGNYGEDDPNQFYRISFPADFHPVACYHYRMSGEKRKLLFISKEKKVMVTEIPNKKQGAFESYVYTLSVNDYPVNALNYTLKDGRQVLLLTFENDNMHIYTEEGVESEQDKLQKIENAPCISSMCVHYERLFAVVSGQKNRVWFSKELDPTNWNVSLDGAGYIEMADERGAVTKVVDFKGYVYVFREYGIARVSAYADQTEFSITQLYTTSGRIYEGTVAVCGDKIMFLAEDGLYIFDGSNTHHIEMGIENLIDKTKYKHARSAYYNGKYYLACNLKYNDNEKVDTEAYSTEILNNSLITIDINKSVLTIYRGMDISFLNTINETDYSQLICCHNGFRSGMIGQIVDGEGRSYLWKLKKKWVSPKLTFNNADRIKFLKRLEIKVSNKVTIKIKTELEEKVFDIDGMEKYQTLKPNIKGKEFEFIFESVEAQVEIYPPKLTFKVL